MNIISTAAQMVRGNWTQGRAGAPGDRRCGLGHLWDAAGWDVKMRVEAPEEILRAQKIMGNTAYEMFPERFAGPENSKFGYNISYPFAEFNDHPDTTEDDVIVVMEKAGIKFDELVED